jgi:transposase
MWYVGLDVHRDTTTVCIRNSRGAITRRVVVSTTPASLRRVFSRIRGRIRIACESGPIAARLKASLETRYREVIVCDRRRTRLSSSPSKNDRFDAERLSELLRAGAVHPVYVPTPSERALRRLADHHARMVRERVRVIQRLRALFLECGIPLDKRRGAAERVTPRKVRDPVARYVVEAYLRQLGTATELVGEARLQMLAAAERYPAFKNLQTIPYVGEIRAAEILAVVADPFRFPSLRAFWSYAGLGVVQRVSAEHHVENGRIVRAERSRGVRIAKTGQMMLKKVLRDVALHASLGRGEFRMICERHLARGKRLSIARLALARKIAAVVYAIMRSGFAYDVSILRRSRKKGSGRASVREFRFGGKRTSKAVGLTICRPDISRPAKASRTRTG